MYKRAYILWYAQSAICLHHALLTFKIRLWLIVGMGNEKLNKMTDFAY